MPIYKKRKSSMVKLIMLLYCILSSFVIKAQNEGNILIDGTPTIFKQELSLPYWLKSGQTLDIWTNISSISVIEFNIDSTSGSLIFSKVLSITKLNQVPAMKVWKIEALGFKNSSSIAKPSNFISPKVYNSPGSYVWIVPPGITSVCIEVWGGGGNGAEGTSTYNGGGGGGGGYGYQCFNVSPGKKLYITVGGSNEDSKIDSFIYATAGKNGVGDKGGLGGSSNASYKINGENGQNGNTGCAGRGGAGGNGGASKAPYCCGSPTPYTAGNFPSGGSGGGQLCYSMYGNYNNMVPGANGQVIIYW
jgi:hypothetical protein